MKALPIKCLRIIAHKCSYISVKQLKTYMLLTFLGPFYYYKILLGSTLLQ